MLFDFGHKSCWRCHREHSRLLDFENYNLKIRVLIISRSVFLFSSIDF